MLRDKLSHKNLESLVARKITQQSRIMWIVFENQEDCIVRLQIVAVVRNLFDRMFRDAGGGRGGWRGVRSLHYGRAGRSYVGLRQVKGESTSLSRSAAQLDFAAKQAGQLTTDCQPKTGAAVLAAGAGICLLEGLEDDPLFVRWNTDPGIGNLKGHHRRGPSQDRMIFAPTAFSLRDGEADASLFGEFEGIGQQILQHLLQTLRVSDHAAAEVRIGLHLESEMPVLGFVTKRTFHHIQQTGEEYFFCLYGDCS